MRGDFEVAPRLRMDDAQGDVMKLSLLVLATALACGNATSNEPTATPNAQSQTQTTGATVPQRTYKSGDYNQTTVGNGVPGAGADRSIGVPPGNVVGPGPKQNTPTTPAPPNTGDPPPIERR
jgi:hypothetical protein